MTTSPSPSRRDAACRATVAVTALTLLGCASPPAAGAPRQSSATAAAGEKVVNAAQARYGARVSVAVAPGSGGSRDPGTPPEATFDGDVHSRCVLRGSPPYTFTIELPFSVPVRAVALAHSDYARECAPREVEVSLDGGPPVRHALELRRPERRRPAWQEVPLGGKVAKVVKVTVLSDHVPDAAVNWGGLGEIAVLTAADLDARFALPVAPAGPAFVHAGGAAAGDGAKPTPVRLPTPARPGEHPRLLLTPVEVAALKSELPRTERGRAALKALIGVADAAAASAPNFPDPKGPQAQVTSRGDEIAKRHDRLALNAGSLGVAYALTGNDAYARRAAEILRGYAARYAEYPEHRGVNRSDTGKVMAQRLSEAMWLIPLIQAYDYVHDSGALTAEDRKSVEERLIRPAIAFIRRKEPSEEVAARDRANRDWRTAAPAKGGAANWLLFYNAATMMAGATMGDRDLVDLAAADFRHLLANGIGSDGMWREGAIGYQFFALSALVGGVETAARQGIDLWSFDNSRLKRLFDSPLRYAYPDGSAPGINDSGRARFGDWSTMAYDYAHLRYGDPAYAFLVNASPRQLHLSTAVYFPTRVFDRLPEPAATSYPGTVFDSLGYAVLRAPRVYALMDYGPHGGVHGHPDKLNLILFASGADGGKGDEMGGEPRFYPYENPLHAEWTTRTVAHNTVTVDETSQVASEGQLLLFEETPGFRVMRARTAASVPGALLDRTVVTTPDGAVLDLFHGRSGFRRTWDRTLRFQGALRGVPATPGGAALGARDGYQHLREQVARRPADAGWEGVWQTTAGNFRAALAGSPGQSVVVAVGPDGAQAALARQEGERADFAVAYALEGWPNPPTSVRWLPAVAGADAVAAELTHADGAVTTVFVAHGEPGKAWEAGGWRSDARVLCVRRQGARVSLLLTGGAFAENAKAGGIRRDAPGNYAAESRAAGRLEVVSAWTPPPPPSVR